MRDPYDVLGLTRDATEDQIKTAYRRLAMEYHPDRNPGQDTAEKFKEISAAYEQLKDPKKRAQHDASQNGFHGFDFGSGMSFEDIFSAFSAHVHNRNRDIHVRAVITLEEAFTGKTIKVQYANHSGQHTANVTLPPGVDSNMRIKLEGKGATIFPNHPPGDLYVSVSIAPHHIFQRSGPHLLASHRIDAFDAILGTTISMNGLDGETITATVFPGTQAGSRIKIAGKGMPIFGGQPGQRGDLIVALTVETPVLTNEQTEALKQLRAGW